MRYHAGAEQQKTSGVLQSERIMHSVIRIGVEKQKTKKHTCQSVSVARNMQQNNAEGEKRWERTEQAKGKCLRKTARELFH